MHKFPCTLDSRLIHVSKSFPQQYVCLENKVWGTEKVWLLTECRLPQLRSLEKLSRFNLCPLISMEALKVGCEAENVADL